MRAVARLAPSLAIFVSTLLHPAWAQPADAGEFYLPGTTHRLAQFPKVHRDGRVWFQFKAPDARKVQVHMVNYNKTHDMEKLAGGLWNLVLPSPGPGLHYYEMVVDGLATVDPGSETFYSNGIKTAVEVPAPGEDFYDIKQVPHGHVLQHVFYSKVTGSWRRMFVYTPPGYDAGTRRYPVLYLQHGAGEDEVEWTHAGRAHFILDNLLAENKAVPMLIVMNNGFAARAGTPPPVPGAPAAANRFAAFEEMLVKEVVPEVDAKFRTIPGRDHRAMAGLSMGGMQTFQIAPTHLDLFSYIGMFSGTPMAASQPQVDAIANQGAAFNNKVHLLWFGVGTAEANFYNRTKEVRAQFDKAGIRSGYFESQGTAHEFQTWRRCLREFAPLLFRQPAPASKKK
jgi:enterochelin esterase-like enzyme